MPFPATKPRKPLKRTGFKKKPTKALVRSSFKPTVVKTKANKTAQEIKLDEFKEEKKRSRVVLNNKKPKPPKRKNIYKNAIRSTAITQAAKGQTCTLQIVGVCNNDPSTTVGAHLPDESNGKGIKADDISLVFGCSDCHDFIDDRRREIVISEYELEWYMRRALIRTLRILFRMGILLIK